MNDNSQEFKSGAALLAAWGCTTREQKLERAVKALMSEISELHGNIHGQELKGHEADEGIFCSCMDAYRMGYEALK